MPCSTLSRPSFLLAFIALMAFVKAATAGEQENPYIVIKPSKDSGSLVFSLIIGDQENSNLT